MCACGVFVLGIGPRAVVGFPLRRRRLASHWRHGSGPPAQRSGAELQLPPAGECLILLNDVVGFDQSAEKLRAPVVSGEFHGSDLAVEK